VRGQGTVVVEGEPVVLTAPLLLYAEREFLSGFLIFPCLCQRCAEVDASEEIVNVECDGFPEGGDRLIVLALTIERIAA
jgi:hypothetical protein